MVMTATKTSTAQADSPTWGFGLFHLGIVYLVWGSTYLAIRVAVSDGSGIEPFMLGGTRTLCAGLLLLLWNLLRRIRVLPSRREALTLALSGLLLWIGGNGLVNWAEQRADSGYAALLVGTTPLWVALVESILDRRPPTLRLLGALALGFAGLAVLTYPQLREGDSGDLFAVFALLIAPLSWGTGSVLQARRPVGLAPSASSALQQLVGAAGFLLIASMIGEPLPAPTGHAFAALIYLIVAGSLIAFTSFIRALRLLPTPVVMTYAYVNPVIAVFLGWLILSEPVTGWTGAGTALILLGVAGVFREKKTWRKPGPPAQVLPGRMPRAGRM